MLKEVIDRFESGKLIGTNVISENETTRVQTECRLEPTGYYKVGLRFVKLSDNSSRVQVYHERWKTANGALKSWHYSQNKK